MIELQMFFSTSVFSESGFHLDFGIIDFFIQFSAFLIFTVYGLFSGLRDTTTTKPQDQPLSETTIRSHHKF